MAGQFETVDAETVATLLGVSPRQVNNYINLKGLPSQGEGRRRTFVWGDVREWYVQYRISLEMGDGTDGSLDDETEADTSDGDGKKEDIRAANLRKTKAEADLKQLALSRLRGEVITIGDAKTRLDRMLGNLRAQLLGLAPKLSNRIEGERDPAGREAAIRDEMAALCRELSTGAVVGGPPEESAEAIEQMAASAEAEADVNRIVVEFLEAHAEEQDAHAALQP